MQPSAQPLDLARLEAAWAQFIASGQLAPELDPVIAGSWQRCSRRLNPRGRPQWIYASPSMLPLISVPHSFLRMVARPVMEDVYQYIEGSGALLLLTDAAACVFELLGDPAIEALARSLGFKPGAFLDESRIGTNAFSIALVDGIPVQVAGPEHFLQEWHGLYTAAAPIHDPAGNAIGTIGLLQKQGEALPLSLGVVFAAAKAVENQLQSEYCIREANAQASEFNATLDAVSEGILAWTTQGIVTHLNGQGGRLLDLKPTMIVGRPLMDHLTLSENIARAAASGEELNDVEASFMVGGEKHDFSVSLRVIRRPSGESEAFIVTLRPLAQVHQLVNRLLGSQARLTLADIVGQGAAIQQLRRQSLATVNAKGGVLLVGEPGTGANVLARAIHNSGLRASGPFLSFQCRAIPRELVLEEFLGFEPGAVSGSGAPGQPSKFELADGGTLFLEDVDALPLEMQSILARILETGQVVRLGGKRAIAVDVRVLASTETRLDERLKAGSFRPDLFRLLNTFAIELPPLRERMEDLPLLIERSLDRHRLQLGRTLALSPQALATLGQYPWHGNLAELGSVLELAAFNAEGQEIGLEHLPESLQEAGATLPDAPAAPVTTIKEMEKVAIVNALRAARGNHSRAAQSLCISRNTLYRKMKELGIPKPERD
jgi:transcriptional regulator of acetoin/glycerol metabolism